MEGFGGSTPNLGDYPAPVNPNIQTNKKSKSGIVFGNNTSYNEGRILYFISFHINADHRCTSLIDDNYWHISHMYSVDACMILVLTKYVDGPCYGVTGPDQVCSSAGV